MSENWMRRFTPISQICPHPPPNVSKEVFRMWNAWGQMTNKEVTRESSSKGLHVQLAITFLAARQKIDRETAKMEYESEVRAWVHELLDRKQIVKAYHILRNIDVDPDLEMSLIMHSTTNEELRNYLGNHLLSTGKLSEKLKISWEFYQIILENQTAVSKYKLETNSIECLDGRTSEWKSDVAGILFIITDDPRLMHLVKAESLWEQLITRNYTNLILKWIDLKFSNESLDNDPVASYSSNKIELFRKFSITDNMLDFLYESGLSTKQAVLNKLTTYGVFCASERNNLLIILKRLKDAECISNIYQILSQKTSSLNVNQFNQLLIDFCLDKRLYSVMNWCLKDFEFSIVQDKHLELLRDLRELNNNITDLGLENNIFNAILVLVENYDFDKYFQDYPLVLIALAMFSQNKRNFLDLFAKKCRWFVSHLDLANFCPKALENLPNLNAIIRRKLNGNFVCQLSLYDLLDKHLKIDSKLLFKHQFGDNAGRIIHFNDPELVAKYAYSKPITYKYYLKQSRPVMAAKLFESEHENITRSILKLAEMQATQMAINNYLADEITSSCVAFLELIQCDSYNLRAKIGLARTLHLSGNYTERRIKLIILNNHENPQELQNIMDRIVVGDAQPRTLCNGKSLVEILKRYTVLVKFSQMNGLNPPNRLLRQCAKFNLWLPFLLIAQLYNYPVDYLRLQVQFFKNPTLSEHLTHAILNDICIDDCDFPSPAKQKKELPRKASIMALSEKIPMSPSLSDSCTNLDVFEIDCNMKATLLQTLIKCHNSSDPPKALMQASQLYHAPLLALIANCYEPEALITNWLTWLSVSCDLCEVFTNYEPIASSADEVSDLLETCMKNGFPRAIHDSFAIFLPENPLTYFTQFLIILISHGQKEAVVEQLKLYEQHLKPIKRYPILSEPDHEITYLRNRTWIESVALKLLASILDHNCRSFYEQIMLTEQLNDVGMWPELFEEVPHFENLLRILKSLHECNTKIRLDITDYFDSQYKREAVISCINSLLELHQYGIALEIAQAEQLPPDIILVKQWQHKFNDQRQEDFWERCDEVFEKYQITADCAADFYAECSDKVLNFPEKYSILKLACKWAGNADLSCQYELERKMWVVFLQLDPKHRNLSSLDIKPASFLYKDLKIILDDVSEYDGDLTKENLLCLDRILILALKKTNFWLALRLQKMFGLKNRELEILKTCYDLAEGSLLPYEMNTEQRLLVSNAGYFSAPDGRQRSRHLTATRILNFRMSSNSTDDESCLSISPINTATDDDPETDPDDNLILIKSLVDNLENGSEIGKNIFMTYRISVNTQLPYSLLVETTDYMTILKITFDENCSNKYEVIHDFTRVYNWPKEEIADFVCGELVSTIDEYAHSNSPNLILWDIDLNTSFSRILHLIHDNCSILGRKLFSYASALHQARSEAGAQIDNAELCFIIELIIKAHDCFTADCNVEGISLILKKTKEMIQDLENAHQWSLMVRLLTGIARYTEMDYVFHVLRHHDQFEFLLGKGTKNDTSLKVALLDYLKKHCSDNHDLHRIVALHFALYSEVARLWEKEAQQAITDLIAMTKGGMDSRKVKLDENGFVLLPNNDVIKARLDKIMENYIHATEFHLEGEKLTQASHSAKQAELIAVQMSLLNDKSKSNAVCILNITTSQIAHLVSYILSFEQSLILVEAYTHHPDWADVLYQQVIVKDNAKYLEDFLRCFPITDSIACNIARKFSEVQVNTPSQIRNMKFLINRLSSVQTKYKLASQLGFSDLVCELLDSKHMIYLKDTVWKSGFKS